MAERDDFNHPFLGLQEQKLPKEKKEATVWESEELALRFLLEEGKLTL